MTKEEYESALQKEADRRVAQAIKKREAEHKKELEQRTAEARKEAEELAKLSESERLKVEKEREELTLSKQREDAIRKLPIEFAGYILGEDADDTFERITIMEEQWQKALEVEINERLKSKTPRLGTSNKKSFFTREQVEKMSPSEVTANLPEIEESMKNW